jgi:sulfate permease, SulP family
MLVPKLITTLKEGYSFKHFRQDAMSGIMVGIVALPLAIAFAIASGVGPERGLITAVIAGFIISAFGGSRVQIGGPTGAFVIIVYGIIQKYGIDGLLTATFMGGIILVFFGLAKFGNIIKFIPRPVIMGFTSGIAILIFSSQIKDFFGLDVSSQSAEFIDKWKSCFEAAGTFNLSAFFIGVSTIVIMLAWQSRIKKIPGSLVAIVAVTIVARYYNLPVETIGDRFGTIPNSIPWPAIPKISLPLVRALIQPAFVIAILAGIESLLSAVVADGMTGGKHRSNMELIAQGGANIASSLFGGIPATGAIARTATNVHNGGKTPVAGIVHSFTVLAIMIFLSKWATLIPLPCLAGILVIVAYRMGEWHSFISLLRSPKSDVMVLLATFLLTILVDLTVAIQIGMVLAAFLLVYRLSSTTGVRVITAALNENEEEAYDPNSIDIREVPEGIEVFEITGPFFFGMAESFTEIMSDITQKPKVRILRMRNALSIDATALNALRQILRFSRSRNIELILSGVHAQPLMAMRSVGLYDEIGEDMIFGNIDAALNKARKIMELPLLPPPVPFVPSVKREAV